MWLGNVAPARPNVKNSLALLFTSVSHCYVQAASVCIQNNTYVLMVHFTGAR